MDQVNVILLLTLSFTYAQSQDCTGGSVYDGVNGDSVVDPGGFWYLNSNLPTTCSGDVLRYNIEYSGTGSLTVSLWSPTDNMGNYEKVQNSEFNIPSPTNTFDVSDLLAVRKGAIVGVYLSDSNPLQVISNVTGQSVQDAGVCVSSSDLAATEIVCSDEASLILRVNVEIDIINCGGPSGGTNNFNNGEIFPNEDNHFGAVIRYSCNTGYSLIGNANRTCQADGDWTDRPMCNPDCENVDPPENGEIVDSETIETIFNSVIEFMCNTGYMLNGAKSITCQSDGSWSADVPTCDIINLPTSSTGESTQVSSSAISSPIPSVDSVQDGGLPAGGIAAIVIILLMVVVAIVLVMIALLIWMRIRSPNRKKPKMENGGISNELYGVTGTVHTQQNSTSPSIQGSTVLSTTLPNLPPRNDWTTSSVLGTSLPGYYDIAEMELLKNGNTINAVYTDVQVYSEVGPVPHVYSSPDEGRYGVPDANPYEIPSRHEKEIYIQMEKNRVLTIPNDRVEVTTYLGSGQFGTVHQAVLSHQGTEIDVAVKTLKHEASEEEKIKFLQEAATMGQFHNTNVVKLFGVVTDNPKNLMLVVELLEKGDLHQFLMKMRPKETGEILPQNTPFLLLSFCRQICLGMTYLSGKGFIHRDLAARNILLSEKNICKIADFGMSRDITDDNYYVATEGGKIPVKWTAPEALTYRKYSSTSDVWSFGCVLYEIWAVGTKPFEGRSNQEAMLMIENGYRLPPSPGCPKPIYETMIHCWHPEPKGRPNFHDIMLVFLGHDQSILEIPENDLATHPLAGILSADLQAGENMYKTLQNTYIL